MRRSIRLGWVLAAVTAAGCGDDGDTSSATGGGAGGGSTVTSAAASSTGAGVGSTGGSDTGGGTGDGGGGAGGGAAIELDITWEPCPLYSDGSEGRTVECATIAVPSKWDDPSS